MEIKYNKQKIPINSKEVNKKLIWLAYNTELKQKCLLKIKTNFDV